MPRINSTGRRRISRHHVQISVTGIGGIETFSAMFDLGSYRFPATARVVVEAYRQLDLVRFDFGTISRIKPPENCRLSEFGTLTGLRFRVRIISEEVPRGRLLGVADRILPEDSQQQQLPRVPLLLVRSQDLGREIWRLEFDDEPRLLINSRVADKQQLVQSAAFQSLVLPEILRSILSRLTIVRQRQCSEQPTDWTAQWLRFAISLPGVSGLPEQPGGEPDPDWVDMVVGSFCRWRQTDQLFRSFWRNPGPTPVEDLDSSHDHISANGQEHRC